MENLDLSEIIRSYTKHWKWFLLSLGLFLFMAFLYLRYVTPMYQAEAKIKIEPEENSTGGIDLFSELDIFSGNKTQIEDEIEIITSRSNFNEVVKSLGLNVRVLNIGNIRNNELYNNAPFKVKFIGSDSLANTAKYSISIKVVNKTSFELTDSEERSQNGTFGSPIPTPFGDIVIVPEPEIIEKFIDKDLIIELIPTDVVAQKYQSEIVIAPTDEFSHILNLTLNDSNEEKAKDILNEIIAVYNRNAVLDKKEIADRTSKFIDNRLAGITTELTSVDQTAEEFKTGRGVSTDLDQEASINLSIGAATRQELAAARTQLNIASSMKDIVDNQKKHEVLPSNLGLDDPSIGSITQKYNQLVLERKRLSKSSNDKNPVIQNLDQQLSSLKRTMQASINSMVENVGLKVNNLSGQQAIINSKIYSTPGKERQLRDITRRQQTTESLFLYLLQKREEAQIAVASAAPKCRVVDMAYNPSKLPVAPRKGLVYLASTLLALLLPFMVIYTKDLLNNKVENLSGLEKIIKNYPILGELPHIGKKDSKLVLKNDRSILAESLRIIRTNLDYLLKSKKNKNPEAPNNLVFVSSGVSREGKTFVSSNLAMILASTNKKVLIIGADIRNPKIHNFFGDDKHITVKGNKESNLETGLTEYLFDNTLKTDDIIHNLEVNQNKIDVIYSGRIPPNPAELLLSSRLESLFERVSKKYDYVIVDTAPLMVVTDTLLISKYASLFVYVTRANSTELKSTEFAIRLREQGKIHGLCFLVNDVSTSNLGYAGKYGYGYGQTKKKWWDVI